MNILTAALAACVSLLLTVPTSSAQQSYPNKPVRIVVPFAPAGPTDAVSRILGQKMGESLGQQFVIENRPGAGGNIGIGAVAKSAPDGYTLLMVSSSFVVNSNLYANAGFDPFNDFAPVTNAGNSPNLFTVNPTLPAKDVKELVALVKANPGKYSYATPGIGTTGHLAGELFRLSLGLDLVAVPFNGAGPAITSILQGQTPIAVTAVPPATEHIKAGSLRGIAISSDHRLAALPDVPTLDESGIRDQVSYVMHGVLAPAGTPPEIVDLLYREIAKTVALPEVQQRFAQLGFEPLANTPAQFAAQIKQEVATWAKVIKTANIKVE
jgi:tripartite-type tricarboxylate transporter receptor subunit TctC